MSERAGRKGRGMGCVPFPRRRAGRGRGGDIRGAGPINAPDFATLLEPGAQRALETKSFAETHVQPEPRSALDESGRSPPTAFPFSDADPEDRGE